MAVYIQTTNVLTVTQSVQVLVVTLVLLGVGAVISAALKSRPKLRLMLQAAGFAVMLASGVAQARHQTEAASAQHGKPEITKAVMFEIYCGGIFYYLNAGCW